MRFSIQKKKLFSKPEVDRILIQNMNMYEKLLSKD